MKLRKDKVQELLNRYFNGNYNRFAREISVDPSHLYRFTTAGIGGGKKMIGAVMKFCKEKRIQFDEYIEL